MAFEIQRTKERVNIYGTWYDVKQPTVAEAISIEKNTKGKNEAETVPYLIDYVSSLGIPKEVIETMEQSHFIDLVTYLAQSAKKKKDLATGS